MNKMNKLLNQTFKERANTMILGEEKKEEIILPLILKDLKNNDNSSIIFTSNPSFSNKVFDLVKKENIKVLNFEPTKPDCPYYNPLNTSTYVATRIITETYKDIFSEKNIHEEDISLLECAIRVIKKVYEDRANLNLVEELIENKNNKGSFIIDMFFSKFYKKNDIETAKWLLNNLINNNNSNKFENVKKFLRKINNDTYLGRLLNPPKGVPIISFYDAVKYNQNIIIDSNNKFLLNKGTILAHLIMHEIQLSLTETDSLKEESKPICFYIDDLSLCYNSVFPSLYAIAPGKKVALISGIRSFSFLRKLSGEDFKIIFDNMCNEIFLPDSNAIDRAIILGDKSIDNKDKVLCSLCINNTQTHITLDI